MPKVKIDIAKQILFYLKEIGDMFPQPFETPYSWVKRAGKVNKQYYDGRVSHLKRIGAIEVSKKQDKRFIKITLKGQMEVLFWLARQSKPGQWDGKWRLVIFDIPESHHQYRDRLRGLLKKTGFKLLQASVYVNPHPLNRHAIEYLRRTGLIHYIRIMRVDEMDDEKELLQRFKLKRKS